MNSLRKVVCRREEIVPVMGVMEFKLRCCLFKLAFLLKLLLVSFEVLYHKVLPSKLVVIPVMVDFLVGLQVEVV